MAQPNATFDEILTTTLYNRSKQVADNLSNNTALLFRMKERGRVRPVDGGNSILEHLAFSGPGNGQWYSGYDALSLSQQDMLTTAEFNFKQYAVAVSASGLEMLRNSGAEKFIDLMASRIEQAEREMVNDLSTGLYAAGTEHSGKIIGGLQSLVSDAGTGTVGGIDSSTYPWWQNYVYDFSNKSITASSTTIQAAMQDVYLNTSRNRDHADLIVADNTYFSYFWSSLTTNQRFTNPKLAEAGFENVRFMGADVTFDGGLNGAAPSTRMYSLNTNFIHFRPHKDRNMVPLNPDRYATNQDAVVKLLAFAGNMTVSNRALQGAIVA